MNLLPHPGFLNSLSKKLSAAAAALGKTHLFWDIGVQSSV